MCWNNTMLVCAWSCKWYVLKFDCLPINSQTRRWNTASAASTAPASTHTAAASWVSRARYEAAGVCLVHLTHQTLTGLFSASGLTEHSDLQVREQTRAAEASGSSFTSVSLHSCFTSLLLCLNAYNILTERFLFLLLQVF